MRRLRKKKGQSTVEYVIVFTAIATALIYAAINIIRPAVNSTYSESGRSINAAGSHFTGAAGFGRLNITN